jgi:predicted Fe-Mo cluster-binding NifX family protein
MRIGVPTNDGTAISEHFGRSAAFLIFETENGQIKSRESKSNGAKHSHAQGACDRNSADKKPHGHAGILAALDACEVVICAGMGQRAAEALKGRGTQIVVVAPLQQRRQSPRIWPGSCPPRSKAFANVVITLDVDPRAIGLPAADGLVSEGNQP